MAEYPPTGHDAADEVDGDFFVNNPERLHFIRPALEGEVEAVEIATGKTLPKDECVPYMVMRRDGDQIIRAFVAAQKGDVADLESNDEDLGCYLFQCVQDGRIYDPGTWYTSEDVH